MSQVSIAGVSPAREEVVGWIRQSTREVFQTMLGMEAEPVDDSSENADNPFDDSDKGLSMGVIGIIGLVGDWTGTAIVSCSSPLACKIANVLFLQEYLSVTDDVLDAVAEMTNIIIGNLKNNLECSLGQMGLSIPAVVFGHNFATRRSGRDCWYAIKFLVNGESFEVQLYLTPSKAGTARRIQDPRPSR